MDVFVEVKIRSNRGAAYIINTVRLCCANQSGWVFDEERSIDYSSHLPGGSGCIIVVDGDSQKLGIALCEGSTNLIEMANIVPNETSSISPDEYNRAAHQFANAVRQWSRQNKAGLRLLVSKVVLELDDIITAKIPLKTFKKFLRAHPLSRHPLDIARLDQFTCTVSRYSRKRIKWEYLGEYLKEKEHWSQKNVEWCLERIRIGLEVIGEYKKL